MEGGDKEHRKHACRVCRRSFPCGRSLGGHMRSHISRDSPSEVAEERPPQQNRSPTPVPSETSMGLPGSEAGYGLRENPKKTWRVYESIGVGVCTKLEQKLCRQCGKGFPSWRALFGHMKCHSARQQEQEGAQEAGEHTEEEEEEEEEGGGSWDSGTVGVALCLMMLSRDVGLCVTTDESSSSLEKMVGIAPSGKSSGTHGGDWRLGKSSPSKKRKVSMLDAEVGGNHGNPCHGSSARAPHRKSKFECKACGKAFLSYQALGGHRAGHKRRHFAVSSGAGGFHGAHHQQQLLPAPPGALDLNLPVAADEESAVAGGYAGGSMPWSEAAAGSSHWCGSDLSG